MIEALGAGRRKEATFVRALRAVQLLLLHQLGQPTPPHNPRALCEDGSMHSHTSAWASSSRGRGCVQQQQQQQSICARTSCATVSASLSLSPCACAFLAHQQLVRDQQERRHQAAAEAAVQRCSSLSPGNARQRTQSRLLRRVDRPTPTQHRTPTRQRTHIQTKQAASKAPPPFGHLCTNSATRKARRVRTSSSGYAPLR